VWVILNLYKVTNLLPLADKKILFSIFVCCLQCCNDVVNERFSSELKYDVTMRLAALQIQEHLISNHASPNKVSVKALAYVSKFFPFLPCRWDSHLPDS